MSISYGHPFVLMIPGIDKSFFTRQGLEKLHLQFYHPSSTKLFNLLEKGLAHMTSKMVFQQPSKGYPKNVPHAQNITLLHSDLERPYPRKISRSITKL